MFKISPFYLIPRLALWALLCTRVLGFKFVHSDPAHCSDITFHWTGGSPPFRLLIISPLQPIRNISIPDSAFNQETEQGTFTTQLLFEVHNRVMFTMSDATGIAAGGITPMLTVGDSKNLGCNATSPVPDFFFSLNKDLLECQPYEFSLYPNATQPLTVMYFVPNGEFFQITAPIGDTFSWRNNLTAGTEVIFSVKDAQGRDGGCSGSKVVITSNDTSCLKRTKTGSRNVAAIAGGVAGGIVGLLLIATLLWFFLRRRRRTLYALEKGKLDLTYDPIGGTMADDNELVPHPYIIEPLPDPTVLSQGASNSTTSKSHLLSTQASSQHLSVLSSPRYSEFSHSSSNSGNLSMYTEPRASVSPSQRVIVHTDIAETEGPVELPPQYSDRRAPIPGLPSNVIPPSPSASSSGPSSPRPRKS